MLYPSDPNPLSVLYVGGVPPRQNSLAIVGGQVVRGLAERGHRVWAISWRTAAESLPPEGGFERDHQNLRVTRLLVPSVPANRALSSSRERHEFGVGLRDAVAAHVAVFPPDILLVGGMSLGEYLPALLTVCPVPSVVALHGGTAFGIRDGTIPESASRSIVEGLRHADLLVGVSPQVARELARLGLNGMRVIGNPVDVDRFAPRPKDSALLAGLGASRSDIVIVHASTLSTLKRSLDVVVSAEIALREDSRLRYLILGDGPLRTAMEDRCARSRIAERFHFTGWIDHAAIHRYLGLADIVVVPSELEARSLVYLEALACGQVLVASDIAAAREVVKDGETGFLFRRGDIADLARRTLEAAADPERRAAIGVRARQAGLAHASGVVVSAYLTALHEAIARYARRTG
jgi:glycosyltransferase involved in cell wall biosynthesis